MNDILLSALKRRFGAHAEVLPALLPALVSDDPTPFLTRYRPDALCGVPEPTFRKLRSAAREERDTQRRRASVRRALEQAGALTEETAKLVDETTDPAVLEDLARGVREAKLAEGDAARRPEDPMRPVARRVLAEGGETPLAELLAPFCGEAGAPPTADDQRARLVRLVADLLAEDVRLRQAVRGAVRRAGAIHTTLVPGRGAKDAYRPFDDATRPLSKLPGRALLLLRRGQKTGAIRVKPELPPEERDALLAGPLAPREGHPYADVLREAAADSLDRALLPGAMNDVLRERKRSAERALLPLFSQALRDKLMTPPAGHVAVVSVVPGATGSCRILAVDAQGRPAATVAVHPLPPRNEKDEAVKALADAIKDSGAKVVAIASSGRARALREWVLDTLAANRELGAVPVLVNEAPAVALSETEADKAAAPELPATARVALSLARWVQDPLVESVRYDLCEIPLGPNEHDVDQGELRRRLDETAEACVAAVGVDVNTATPALLARVPGLDIESAARIVAWRDTYGPFATRADVRKVEGLEEQAWQHAAGFLRVKGGVDPLDATGIHPTGAHLVPAIAAKLAVEPQALIGHAEVLAPLDPKEFAGPVHTEADVKSVVSELGSGAHDPRGTFVPPAFNPGVVRARDLTAGMELDGVVTSVSKFGAFIDVGVGQDGLVHVSELAHEFVREPADVVKVGQTVRVKVVAVDGVKRRISLSVKALLPVPARAREEEAPRPWRGRTEGTFGGEPARPADAGRGGAPGARDRPRRPRPDGPPGAARGAPGTERRGPGGFMPERPGTAPRRAQRRGRFGEGKKGATSETGEADLSRDGGAGSFRDLTGGRGGRRGAGGGDRDRPPRDEGRRAEAPKELDPFQQQLAALREKLGLAGAAPSPRKERPQPAEAVVAEQAVAEQAAAPEPSAGGESPAG